jgi:monoamine oxidase
MEGLPELGGRLLFAGEHTSTDYSGFMNGAVESGLRVADEITGRRTAQAA